METKDLYIDDNENNVHGKVVVFTGPSDKAITKIAIAWTERENNRFGCPHKEYSVEVAAGGTYTSILKEIAVEQENEMDILKRWMEIADMEAWVHLCQVILLSLGVFVDLAIFILLIHHHTSTKRE